ncbi:MAG: hypothetical protein WDW38_010791 [Sanguina aurantia]
MAHGLDPAYQPPGYDLHLAASAGLMHVYEGLSGSFASMATPSSLGMPGAVSMSYLLANQQHLESVASTAPPPDVGDAILTQIRGSVKARINSCWSVEAVKQGVVHAKGGNHEEAASCYAKALELDPGNSDAYVARGALQANRKHLSEAAADFGKALALNPGNVNAGKYLEAVRTKQQQQREEEEGDEPEQQQPLTESKPSPSQHHLASLPASQHGHRERPRQREESGSSQGEEEDRDCQRRDNGRDYRQQQHEEGRQDRQTSSRGRQDTEGAQRRQPADDVGADQHHRGHGASNRQQQQHDRDRSPPRDAPGDGERYRMGKGGGREPAANKHSPARQPHHSRSRSPEREGRPEGKDRKERRHKETDGGNRGKDRKDRTKKRHRRSAS